MILELSDLAIEGLTDPVKRVEGYVELLVETRDRLRADKLWEAADHIRSGLTSLGVTLQDTPEGTRWTLEDSGQSGRTPPT